MGRKSLIWFLGSIELASSGVRSTHIWYIQVYKNIHLRWSFSAWPRNSVGKSAVLESRRSRVRSPAVVKTVFLSARFGLQKFAWTSHSFISYICTIYNMSGRVVSDIQARAKGERLYIWNNTVAHVVNVLKNERYYLFICEVIFKINVV